MIANVAYWGFNHTHPARASAEPDGAEGVNSPPSPELLMPVIIVPFRIAASCSRLPCSRDSYPTMMRLLPPGLLGLVFAALVAAIIASTASKINSIATIFTLDLYARFRGEPTRAEDGKGKSAIEEKHLVLVGRITATVAIIIAIIVARPLVGSSEQAFQFIQEFSGFFTPGITVIFLLGLFWKRATEAGAIVAAVTSVGLSTIMKYTLPSAAFSPGMNDYLTPFINRMGVVFGMLVLQDRQLGDQVATGRLCAIRSIRSTAIQLSKGSTRRGRRHLIQVALYATGVSKPRSPAFFRLLFHFASLR